jgi:DNA-binding transcriptional MerR regulator
VAKILGIPRRKVLLFVEHRIIEPAIPSPGRGRPRKFDLADVMRMALAAHMDSLSITPRGIRAILAIWDHTGAFWKVNPEAEDEDAQAGSSVLTSHLDQNTRTYDFFVITPGADSDEYKISLFDVGLAKGTAANAEAAMELALKLKTNSRCIVIALHDLVRNTFAAVERLLGDTSPRENSA